MIPRLLVVGGLDPGGGAGITADAVAAARCGTFALPVAVVLTVQNRRSLRELHEVPAAQWQAALDAAVDDGPLHAIKTGMLAGAAQVQALAERLRPLCARIPLVVDPVLSATAGGFRADAALAQAFLRHLVPLAAVVTPNLPELEALVGDGGAQALLAAGCGAVLVKGGHGGGPELHDVLVGAALRREWTHPRRDVGPVHGTGCALASALAAGLAAGMRTEAACDRAIGLVQQALAAMGPPAPDGLPRPLAWPRA